MHAGAVTKLDVAIATRSALLLEVRQVLRWGGPVGVVGFFFARGRRDGNARVRNVSWAVDVDKDYARSIDYVEQPVNLKKKSTNIS